MNKLFALICVLFLTACSSDLEVEFTADFQSDRKNNIDMAQNWMDNLFIHSDLEAAKSSMHSDFTFVYMGIIEPGGVAHGKRGFIEDYLPIVGELLPTGIILTTVDVIADKDGVALIMLGDAEGINGEYDNKYVFTFKMQDGLIHSVKEYNSDLLVGTRLYKNKLIPVRG